MGMNNDKDKSTTYLFTQRWTGRDLKDLLHKGMDSHTDILTRRTPTYTHTHTYTSGLIMG